MEKEYGTILIVGMVLSIMKDVKKIFVLLVVLLITKNVHAVCDYETQAKLNSEAATIKAIYEEIQKEMDRNLYVCGDGVEECTEYYPVFKISILNLSENFYVKVTSDNKFNKTFYYKDAQDGIISFELSDLSKVNTFTFKVYNTSKSGCTQKLNRTFYLTTPRLNDYYNVKLCDKIPDYYMCQKFVTFEDTGYTDFLVSVNKYYEKQEEEKEETNKTFFEKIFEFIKENKNIFIIAGCVVVIGSATTVIIIKKRRKDIV